MKKANSETSERLKHIYRSQLINYESILIFWNIETDDFQFSI